MPGRSLLYILAIVFGLSLGASAQEAPVNTYANQVLSRISGQQTMLHSELSYHNLILFWATWCSPCIEELDIIAELHDEWQDNYGINIIAISIDDSRAKAKLAPFVRGKRWPFTVLHDINQEVFRSFGFSTVPSCAIIDSTGNITWRKIGFMEGDEYTIESKIE